MQNELLFDRILEEAAEKPPFREALLAAAAQDGAIAAFCRVCRGAGIEIYPMDIADADESAYAAMRRSTNGGGENSPHLNWEDGLFENLLREIRAL